MPSLAGGHPVLVEHLASVPPVAVGALGKAPPARGPTGRTCLCFVEASGVESKEERPGGWVPQLLKKLRLGWFPASDDPKTPSHE